MRRTALMLTSAVLAVSTISTVGLALSGQSPIPLQRIGVAQQAPARLDPSPSRQPQPEQQATNASSSTQQQQAGPSAEEAAQYCLDAMFKNLTGTALHTLLDGTFALPQAAKVFSVKSIGENAMEIVYLTENGQYESAVFSTGAIMARIVGQFKGFELFAIVGPASVYCTQAAFYYVGGQGRRIGESLRTQVFGPTPVTTTTRPRPTGTTARPTTTAPITTTAAPTTTTTAPITTTTAPTTTAPTTTTTTPTTTRPPVNPPFFTIGPSPSPTP